MIPLPFTLHGRTGTIVYLDALWHPVTPELAMMAKVVFDDGGTAFFFTEQLQSVAKKEFDESKHPRNPAGSGDPSGEFTSTGRTGQATPDPELAKQAKDGVVAVEKLLDQAIEEADYSGVSERPESWDDVDSDIQNKVQSEWEQEQWEGGVDVDTSTLDEDIRNEVQRDNQEILDKAIEKTTKSLTDANPFKDTDPTLPLANPGGEIPVQFDLHRVLDYDTIDYGDGDHEEAGWHASGLRNRGGTVALDLDALRFTSGEELTADQKQIVKGHWDEAYSEAYQKELEKAYESDSYSERRSELEQQEVQQAWHNLSDTDKYDYMAQHDLGGKSRGHDLTVGAPDEWVTGVETGQHGDENYNRTHAIALKLTELRTDEIREERGLLGKGKKPSYSVTEMVPGPDDPWTTFYRATEDDTGRVIATGSSLESAQRQAANWALEEEAGGARVRTDQLIEDTWKQWKISSSEGLSLSMQLAVTKEFGGLHRLSDAEVKQAIESAREVGGMANMQAYVRAQWEVTQMVMTRAKQDKVQVYRGLMLEGSRVKETENQTFDKLGGEIKPFNIKAEDLPNPHVSFDFAGEHFVEPRQRTNPPTSILELPPENAPYERMMAYHAAHPYEAAEVTVQRRLDKYFLDMGRNPNLFIKLPDLSLRRAGAQSTTGTPSVANSWQGVGHVPPDAIRVVLRVEAPSTSVLSLPVYGQNMAEEHESVIIGTKDKWMWDAWRKTAPDFRSQSIAKPSQVAQKSDLLVIDLQEEDRGQPHWMQGVDWTDVQLVAKKEFDETKHPRNPSGTGDKAGEFTESGRAGEATPTPELAKQAKDGIAAVEKLIPEATKLAKYPLNNELTEDTPFGTTPKSWGDIDQFVQAQVAEKWKQGQIDSLNVDIFDLKADLQRETWTHIQKNNKEILEFAKANTLGFLEARAKHTEEPIGYPLSGITIDPATFSYGEGIHNPNKADSAVVLDLDKFRTTTGEKLTDEQQQYVQRWWDTEYSNHYRNAIQEAYNSVEYQFKLGQLETKRVNQMWAELPDQHRFGYMVSHNIGGIRNMRPGEPREWVTGVEEGDHKDENYQRTNAISAKLTELRMDEIRVERGLVIKPEKMAYRIQEDPDPIMGPLGKNPDGSSKSHYIAVDDDGDVVASGFNKTEVAVEAERWVEREGLNKLQSSRIISDVWDSWKSSSSNPTSLAMQLAAAEELGGVHRLTPEEVVTARDASTVLGGMETLKAYVRAQWEVTQMVMDKAGEKKIKVYRGLMLDGQRVKETTNQPMGKDGEPLPLPTNVKVEQNHVLDAFTSTQWGGLTKPEPKIKPWAVQEIVTFDYNGEHLKIYKEQLPGPYTWQDVDHEVKKEMLTLWAERAAQAVEETNKTFPNKPENQVEHPFQKAMGMFDKFSDTTKLKLLNEWRRVGDIAPAPFESTESAVNRRISEYFDDTGRTTMVKLPDLALRRAGMQSTTGTASVANDWQGVGELPSDPTRVVLRVEAPSTSVLALPVYGKNLYNEHESVLVGTKDKWLWDAWRDEAPTFKEQPIQGKPKSKVISGVVMDWGENVDYDSKAFKADKLVIDLQEEDRGKPHWMHGTKKREYVRDEKGQFAETGVNRFEALESAAKTYASTHVNGKLVAEASAHILKGEVIPDSENIPPKHAAAANRLVEEIRNAPEHTMVLYRGLGADDPIEAIEKLKVGDTITLDRISSFSANRQVAAFYANRQTMGGETYELQTEGPVKSVPTDYMTGMEHEEHLTEGKFEVVSILEQAPSISEDNGTVVHVEEVAGSKRTFWVSHKRSITLKQVGVF